MKRAFVGTDVILDCLAEREPHAVAAQELFGMADQKEVDVCVSSLCFSNLFYILRELKSGRETAQILRKLKMLVNVLPVVGNTVELALSSSLKDFEDALQYYMAAEHHIRYFITRNTRDFPKGGPVVCTAEEYINIRGLKNL